MKPLSECPLQAHFGNRLQLFNILEEILSEVGPSEIIITTFSTSEEFLRRIFYLRKQGYIRSATLVADLKATRKTMNLCRFMQQTFDRVAYTENHSKVILIQNEAHRIAVVTSQNQTRGNRYEATMIVANDEIFLKLYHDIQSLIEHQSISNLI